LSDEEINGFVDYKEIRDSDKVVYKKGRKVSTRERGQNDFFKCLQFSVVSN